MATAKQKTGNKPAPAPARTASSSTKAAATRDVSGKTTDPWRDVLNLLEEAEAKFEKFEDRAESWLKEQIKVVKDAEKSAERLIDTTRVKMHLGKMDAATVVRQVSDRLDELKRRLDTLKVKANLEAAGNLKKLSDASLKLKDKIETRGGLK